ncbi:dipeptidyl aminopeptidase [Fomitiporia mediterranea MF3/22]|uniref:dipeptidyl aminopeptidase n=1 Tax=Fomitiporia mediterranea (strain MF3/22) TaxID=694068 RepID=UPI0004407CF5|nr:dipeptidyl aminopeptidase [Fomitiporia mediterranea MF3/22]EJC99985.1 dipeptidyl aminopeptidase [Fomitiporia mediterranea MF3/22]
MQTNGYARLSLNDTDDVQEPAVDGEPRETTTEETKAPLRPHMYYDEGPFDAPSSESEDETLLEKDAPGRGRLGVNSPGATENGFPSDGLRLGGPKRRPNTLRCLLITLVSLMVMAILIGILAAYTYTGTAFAPMRGTRPLTMDHVFNGTFYAQHATLRWVPEAGDGVYAEQDFKRSVITLVDLKTNTTRDLVNLGDVKNEQGLPLATVEWKLSPDMKYLLMKANYLKQWRHSSFGNYYVHDIDAKSTYPLSTPSFPPVTAYAAWSPVGDAIAYVQNNDLYVKPDAARSTKGIRITATGSETHFNGVPDWVYEEEVLSADYALWWAPDAKRVAFLESDETNVDVYSFPIYNPTADSYSVHPYTEDVAMRYPKPGYTNPSVDVHVFDLDGYLSNRQDDDDEDDDEISDEVTEHLSRLTWSSRRSVNDSVIMDVAWIGADDLLVKEVNRGADDGVVVHFDMEDLSIAGAEVRGEVVRHLGRNGEEGDGGWIESRQSVYPLPPTLVTTLGLDGTAYLDLVNNSQGYTHIALFSPADSSEPLFVTDGEWEVVDGILGVDSKGIVYFTTAYPSSIERAILAVPIPSQVSSADSDRITELTALTDTTALAWYEASFSPESGYYLLGYRGPNVPWQSVFSTTVPREEFEYKVVENTQLNATLAEYQSPLIMHSTIENDGFEFNTMELLPANFDDSGRIKYPVLFRVYGGPGSQMVHTRFERDWHAYLACTLKYIVVIVDGRGTGFRGRALRNPIRGNLGYWETRDQVGAARIWASKKYVDPKKIGIWGWSYGGFMSSKVVEANEGIHSLAMAVAPVTSWRLYDSIYTERYMSTPQLNPTGYDNASITNMTGFHNAHFLLAHGSGDDNVHFANSAHLLDMLTTDKVRGFRFRMFTDSDHSINRRGAYRELYEWMTGFLLEKWGKGGKHREW